jgi:hypothetical protein
LLYFVSEQKKKETSTIFWKKYIHTFEIFDTFHLLFVIQMSVCKNQERESKRNPTTNTMYDNPEYQTNFHLNALNRLENELRNCVRSIPRQNFSDYKSASPPPPPPRSLFAGSDADIYSRSAVQRYVVQRLAAELHSPNESSRKFVPFSTFQEVLRVENPSDLYKLDPEVQERHKTPAKQQSSMSAPQTDRAILAPLGLPPSIAATKPSPGPVLQEADALLQNPSSTSVASTTRVLLDAPRYPQLRSEPRIVAYSR